MFSLSLSAFQQLRTRVQLTLVVLQGTYLATRFDQEGTQFRLFALHRFFVEVYQDHIRYEHHCHSFVGTTGLEAYLDRISLPNL